MADASVTRCDRCGELVDQAPDYTRATALSVSGRWDLAVGEAIPSQGEGPANGFSKGWTAFVNWQDLCDDCDEEVADLLALVFRTPRPEVAGKSLAEIVDGDGEGRES